MTGTLDAIDARTHAASVDADAATAVRVEGLSVHYDGVPAVTGTDLVVEPGTICALLGPSGCGKTSLLRAIAGLERPTAGTVVIGDRVVSSARTWVKPERRHIGMVFQDGALFPHLTVADNITFGLRAPGRRLGRDERRRRAEELLELVDLAGVGDRLPETLSGGQQQRVALARSLAPNPSVLLLDEPFSALDAGLRIQVRAEVAAILREIGVTSIFVTHDQDEAFVLGDRVAVMRDGHVEQFGAPEELYRSPVSPWVARFVGEANLVPGSRTSSDTADTAIGPVRLTPRRIPAHPDLAVDVRVLLRPEQIAMDDDGDDGVVTTVEYYGHDVRYEVTLDDGTVLAVRTHPDHLHERGDRVGLRFQGSPTEAWPA